MITDYYYGICLNVNDNVNGDKTKHIEPGLAHFSFQRYMHYIRYQLWNVDVNDNTAW